METKEELMSWVLETLSSTERDLSVCRSFVSKYEYGAVEKSGTNDSFYRECLERIPILESSLRDLTSRYYGRVPEECDFRMGASFHARQANALRLEAIEPSEFRCGKRLKESVQRIVDNTGLCVFSPIDFESCDCTGRCYL